MNKSQWMRAKALEFIRKMKSAPCTDCGIQYHYSIMDFDHTGDKKWNISQRRNASISTLAAEIALCDVVCANCHRYRTYIRNLDSLSREVQVEISAEVSRDKAKAGSRPGEIAPRKGRVISISKGV